MTKIIIANIIVFMFFCLLAGLAGHATSEAGCDLWVVYLLAFLTSIAISGVATYFLFKSIEGNSDIPDEIKKGEVITLYRPVRFVYREVYEFDDFAIGGVGGVRMCKMLCYLEPEEGQKIEIKEIKL